MMVVIATTIITPGRIDDAAAKGAGDGKNGDEGRHAARLGFGLRIAGHEDLLMFCGRPNSARLVRR
jgi:hypothetical protein